MSATPLPTRLHPGTRRAATALALAASSLLAACSFLRAPAPAPAEPPPEGRRIEPPPPVAYTPPPPPVTAPTGRPRPSLATDPKAYRVDGAQHLYAANRARIYPGRLPPMLYAVGVLDVEIDGQGQVRGLNWQRAPRHAPEVIAEIERTVRAAAPYPAPARMGRVVYTDIWLWDRSGRFQLDTLTEGQD